MRKMRTFPASVIHWGLQQPFSSICFPSTDVGGASRRVRCQEVKPQQTGARAPQHWSWGKPQTGTSVTNSSTRVKRFRHLVDEVQKWLARLEWRVLSAYRAAVTLRARALKGNPHALRRRSEYRNSGHILEFAIYLSMYLWTVPAPYHFDILLWGMMSVLFC